MDFQSAVKTLKLYLDEQSFLQKVSSLEDLELIDTPVISVLLTDKGEAYHLPEETLFKKGIFSLNDDWVNPDFMSKDRALKKKSPKAALQRNAIKTSLELFDNFVNDKMIKSGYWDLFKNCKEIDYLDNILLLKRKDDSSEFYDSILIKGPINKSTTGLPEFLNISNLIAEFTHPTTPHSRPPRLEHFLSYRVLQKASKLNWDMKQVSTFLGSIWCERTPSSISSRLKLLVESAVLLAEKNSDFNQLLRINKDSNSMVGIPSNFIIAICGGYARDEYSKKSDLDMLLIHEGNEKQFLQVGEALDNVLGYVPNLELCKMENLKNLNFHENSISNILQAYLKGDETYLDKNQRLEIDEMLGSIEQLRKTPLSSEERQDGISKYCWSIYKSIVNMVPIYEKPIGKGDHLRKTISQEAKRSLHQIITVLMRVTDFLNDENSLGENLRVCQPFVYDSIFKKFSALTSLQDVNTILAILSETTFTSSTIDRFKVPIEKNIITEEQGNKLIKGYNIFSRTKYRLTKETPIEALEVINDDMRDIIKDVYDNLLQNLAPGELDELAEPIAYPLLIFSDLHWGLNAKLAKKSLAVVKKICIENQVRSILIAGDLLNIDRVNELEETDEEGLSLINELSQIQNLLGDPRIFIISGNHDLESYYNKFQRKLLLELNIHFIGNHYKDENLWVEHGDSSFWKNFQPPLEQYISKFREENKLNDQKIIVGHNHRIYEEEKLGFYGNGTIGLSFSSILAKEKSIEMIKSPIEYSINFDKLLVEYEGIINADELINEYIQKNFDLIEGDQLTEKIEVNPDNQKRTWIVTDKGNPVGIIPFNKVEEVRKLENIHVYEVSYPLDYTFFVGQTLKEAWAVFSVTGAPLLPVMGMGNYIIGTLSIFSVPKPEKEHTETKEAVIDQKMKSVGDFLTQKLFDQQKEMN